MFRRRAYVAVIIAILAATAVGQTTVGKPGDCYVSDKVVGYVVGPTCPQHFYCPNTTATSAQTYPQICPASSSCLLQRLAGLPCEAQGQFEPVACPFGFYCPTPEEKIICPEGSFCPTGSTAPNECPIMSHCAEGSRNRRYYGGVVICAVIDAALFVVHQFLIRRRGRLLQRKAALPADTAAINGKNEASVVLNMGSVSDAAKSVVDAGQLPKNGDAGEQLLRGYRQTFANSKLAVGDDDVPHLNFQFDNLGCTLPSGQSILSGVTGSIQSGRVTAIMGPSGAGKTTFMSVLMGKMPCSHGNLYVNQHTFQISNLSKIVGYVPQEDIMLREMTVRETISHSANVRLPNTWTAQQRTRYVDAVIMNLGLWGVEHSFIGDETTRGISGGQRKRVNIGIELAAAPLAIFADEPTSGLDSTSALQVATTLKGVAALGVTVVAVLHQPRFEIFEQFDDLLLIAPGGRTAYLGPRCDVIGYFEALGYVFESRQNPADVLMDILSGKATNSSNNYTVADLVERWRDKTSANSPSVVATAPLENSTVHDTTNNSGFTDKKTDPSLPNQTDTPAETQPTATLGRRKKSALTSSQILLNQMSQMRTGASVWRQFLYCHQRSNIQQHRHIQSFGLEIGVATLAGGLMGLSVMGIAGEMFRGFYVYPMTGVSPAPIAWIVPLFGMLNAMAVGIAGAPAGVKTFGEEKSLFKREYSSGHSAVAYYLAKSVAVIYRFVLTALHFTAIVYFLGTPIVSFGNMFLIILMLFYCVFGLASVVSMFTRRENASLLAVVVCLFAATLSGFGPTLTDATKWGIVGLWDISYAKWGAEALFTQEVGFFRGVYDVDASTAVYGYTLDRFWLDIGLMFVIGTVLRAISFTVMMISAKARLKE